MKLVDRVKLFLDEKCQMLATKFYTGVLTKLEEDGEMGEAIESPIEQLFYIEWLFIQFVDSEYRHLYLWPQYQRKEETGKYRLDFMVDFVPEAFEESRGRQEDEIIFPIKPPKLGIEIDSHIWHEKTKKQVQYHKERERFLIAHGWKLLRFTGSEVYENPARCVGETLKIAYQLKEEYLNKVRQKLKERKS